MRILAIAIAGWISSCAYAQDPTAQLTQARTIKCRFAAGFNTYWPFGDANTTTARSDADVTFDEIDPKRGTVKVIGNLGTEDAKVAASPVGLTIIQTHPGVVDVMTVFSAYDKSGRFIAVDTRHTNMSGHPMAEQYFGACTAP